MTTKPDFVGFARELFKLSDWPEGGDIDGFSFQDAAEKHGLLIPEVRTSPCGEYCHCAEYHGDMKDGVTCYRKTEALETDSGQIT